MGTFSGIYTTTYANVLGNLWLKQTYDFPATQTEPARQAESFTEAVSVGSRVALSIACPGARRWFRFRGRVVAVDPETGDTTVLLGGCGTTAAVAHRGLRTPPSLRPLGPRGASSSVYSPATPWRSILRAGRTSTQQ